MHPLSFLKIFHVHMRKEFLQKLKPVMHINCWKESEVKEDGKNNVHILFCSYLIMMASILYLSPLVHADHRENLLRSLPILMPLFIHTTLIYCTPSDKIITTLWDHWCDIPSAYSFQTHEVILKLSSMFKWLVALFILKLFLLHFNSLDLCYIQKKAKSFTHFCGWKGNTSYGKVARFCRIQQMGPLLSR